MTIPWPIWKDAVTLTDVLSVIVDHTAVIDYMAFSNTHSGAVTVTVQDQSGKTLLPGSTVDAGTLMVIPIPEGGLRFNGGVQWKAGTTGKIDAWIRIRPY